LVSMNYSSAQWITYDLGACFSVSGPIRRWTTSTGTGPRYATYADIALDSKSFRSWFPTNTIQTFEIQNVLIAPPRPELTITQQPGTAEVGVSWPDWATGYRLLSATSLSFPPNWAEVTNSPVLSNGAFSVVLG